MTSRRATSSACRSAPARRPRWCGRTIRKPDIRLDNRLKDVEEKLELPPLAPELRSFVDWVANYTVSSRGMVLRMCLRMGEHLGAERERVGVRLAGAAAAAHDPRARSACSNFSPTA